MPLYEYKCHTCGKTMEVMQKFSDSPLTVHQGCGGALEKLISASAFQFKGTGWYITDYARKGKSSTGDHANGKSTKTESKTETGKTESKSEAAKSEPKGDSKPAAAPAPAK